MAFTKADKKRIRAEQEHNIRVLKGERSSVAETTKTELHLINLIKVLADDLNPLKPNFKTTLDSIEQHIAELKKSLRIDTPMRDTVAWDGSDTGVYCNEDFFREDLNVMSTCGRNKGHSGAHSWHCDQSSIVELEG